MAYSMDNQFVQCTKNRKRSLISHLARVYIFILTHNNQEIFALKLFITNNSRLKTNNGIL